MSYNIRHARGMDNQLDIERLAEFIQKHDPDIIGLQEVDYYFSERSEYVDQAAYLGEYLKMHHVYGGSIVQEPTRESSGRERKHGAAILSKYPIVSSKQYLFKHFVGNKRELLQATVDIDGRQISFYSTHLGLNEEERTLQVQEMLGILAGNSLPKIVVGDFNAEPESPEIKLVSDRMKDAFAHSPAALTFRADEPTKRIDYIFASAEIEFQASRVVPTLISDHLPILSYVRFKEFA